MKNSTDLLKPTTITQTAQLKEKLFRCDIQNTDYGEKHTSHRQRLQSFEIIVPNVSRIKEALTYLGEQSEFFATTNSKLMHKPTTRSITYTVLY